MIELTAADVLSTARRAGWQIRAERAAEIAASAAPRIAAFNRVRDSLGFDDDVSLSVVLQETRHQESEQS
jgi:hypothetical protein